MYMDMVMYMYIYMYMNMILFLVALLKGKNGSWTIAILDR